MPPPLFTDAGARNLAFFGSVALSLWAAFADPVVDAATARLLIAAEQLFSWPAALPVGESALLALVVAKLASLLDTDVESAARVCNALFFIWLSLAFVGLVRRLGAEARTSWLAAAVVLGLPALNALRPDLNASVPFAALGLSALSTMFAYRLEHGRGSLVSCVVLVLAAACLRLEALALLAPLVYLATREAPVAARVALGLAAVGALFALLCARIGIDALEHAGVSWQTFAAAPTEAVRDGWTRGRDEFGFIVAAVRHRLLGEFAGGFAAAVVVAGLVTAAMTALVTALGVFALPAAHGLAMRDGGIEPELRGLWWCAFIWFWWVAAVGALGRSPVAPADILLPALIGLSAVPFSLRAAAEASVYARPLSRAVAGTLLAACAVAGLSGLDLRRDDTYLKEAGSWLRAHIAADARIFFGHSAVAYYADRGETLATTDGHAWRETMALFWSGRRRDYRAIVAHIEGARAHREHNLLRNADMMPAKRFTNSGGKDAVIVFQIPPGT